MHGWFLEAVDSSKYFGMFCIVSKELPIKNWIKEITEFKLRVISDYLKNLLSGSTIINSRPKWKTKNIWRSLSLLFPKFDFFFFGCAHGMWQFPGQDWTHTTAVTTPDPSPTEPLPAPFLRLLNEALRETDRWDSVSFQSVLGSSWH